MLSANIQAQRRDTLQNQQKARAVVNQMVAALGGEAYLSLEDSQVEGRVGRFDHGSSLGSRVYSRFWKWPDRERLEYAKDRDMLELFAGDNVHESTSRGMKQLDPNTEPNLWVYLQRRHHALETVVRRWLKDPGTALFYEGPSIAENRAVERVTIINADNDAVTLSIDADTHLPVKKVFSIRHPQNKDRDEVVEIYDNWKTVQGVNTPYNTLVTLNGELRFQYFVSKVSYNSHLPDSLFSLPAGSSTPQQ
jgi:hypothetical protein